MLAQLRAAAQFLRTRGLRQTLRRAVAYTRERLDEARYERRFGINTRGLIQLESLGIDDPDGVWYSPSSYPGFFQAMRHVPVAGAFVDYGSGLGRILVAAGSLGFERVTGIEYSPELVRRCRDNLARARGTVCPNMEVLCRNAAQWPVPEDVTVFHFYNPFRQQTLRTVLGNIAASLAAAPRQAWIVFAFAWEMDPLMCAGELIPHAWQRGTRAEPWPLHPPVPSDPLTCSYRIYALDSTAGSGR
jgi:hypothetical protein